MTPKEYADYAYNESRRFIAYLLLRSRVTTMDDYDLAVDELEKELREELAGYDAENREGPDQGPP